MAKKDLLGGSLWSEYSQEVNRRMADPKHRGDITEVQALKMGGKLIVADYGAESCGDAVRLYWVIDPATHRILDCRFKSFGCGTAIASSDVMAELCIGKTVDEAIKITNIDVEMALRDDPEIPAVPPQKMHCSVMAYDVIKRAAAIYKQVDEASLEEEVIVCECARVSLGTIEEVIRINNLKTVEAITDYTKAGAFCKSCIQPGGHEKREHYLVDILKRVRAEMDAEQIKEQASATDFKAMSLVGKIKAIDEALTAHVKPMLARDGGSVELVDIKEGDNEILVFIQYSGACAGCASSNTGTLQAILGILREKLDERIMVVPV
ncbi:iron-sulfur cluster assembly scaffold protein [Desulfurispirillum indicum]|uniref:iron-sulfur cluster assembly scaffold protein n=1 Tax=Desulfurispirillum indicum TaxID=936456 RepID=UPI001CF9676C|nr:iron-sulfur cluster assembly scaffold protein [Desulfurispirillum indicum]UCZ57376.1 iron-sulfur cluster assembly scaffold protein [Desulfurispirillum indicum]